jgi:hypothetical protein
MPIRRSAFPGGQLRQTNPIRWCGLEGKDRACETKPNLGRMGHLGDSVSEKGQSCETKLGAMPTALRRHVLPTESDMSTRRRHGTRQSSPVGRRHPTGPATGQSRCRGRRREVDSVWSTGFSRIEEGRLKAVLGPQTRYIAFGNPVRTADTDGRIDTNK